MWFCRLCKLVQSAVFITLLFLCTVHALDLCETPTLEGVTSSLQQGVVPRGVVNAGNYTYDRSADSVVKCVASCCLSRTCEVMFFFNDECLLIACNRSWSAACDAVPNKNPRFADAYYLRVRTTDELLGLQDGTTAHSVSTDCRSAGCPDGEECQEEAGKGSGQHVCVCPAGFERDTSTRLCQPVSKKTVLQHKTSNNFTSAGDSGHVEHIVSRVKTRYCTLGLVDQCLSNEQCVVRRKATVLRSRSGLCRCIQGFVRDPQSGLCINAEVKRNDTTADGHKLGPPDVAGMTATTQVKSLAIPTSTLTSTSSKPPIEPLVVSAGDNHKIQLPADSITLYAFVLDDNSDDANQYKYQWSLYSHPSGDETGQMTDIDSASLKLSKLRVGLYTFKVAVTGENKYGEAYVNVTVLPPSRVNTPPMAIVKPSTQEVNEPNDLVIDGAASTDDDQIVSYLWEQVSGKVGSQTNIDTSDLKKPTLVLKGLAPGKYRFKLTVTDSDGAQNYTFADATVIKATDYPPAADAGSNVIISLPQKSVTLYGNSSIDDKKIVSYEWTRTSDDKLAVDMVGVRSPFLRLDNLVVGDYTFRLKVTDVAGQQSTADVHVFVKPEHNLPPVASAGADKTVWLPVETVTLDGSDSSDDQQIASYQWTCESYSSSKAPTIENADRAMATASKLSVGSYSFKLVVKDGEDLTSEDIVKITVKEDEDQPPVADTGGEQIIVLPAPLVTVNGSKSTDDHKIVTYLWTRDRTSPAAGTVVGNTDHEAVLRLTGLVAGHYVFLLEVTDEAGHKSTSTASVLVKPEPHELDLVRMQLSADIRVFTEANKVTLMKQLSFLLHRSTDPGEANVIIESVLEDGSTGQALVTFYVVNVVDNKQRVRPGVEVVSTLARKLHSSTDAFDFRVVELHTVVCQNNCSGHGQCDQASKRCVCSGFWMENFFLANFGERQSNCDWSILYVIIALFTSVLGIGMIVWGITCICRRCTRWRPKAKRQRYTLLEDVDDSDRISTGKLDLLPAGHGKSQMSSVMQSESEVSSEEETIFMNQRKPNGVAGGNVSVRRKPVTNGSTKAGTKTKVSA